MSSCGTPCPVDDVPSGNLQAAASLLRGSGNWFPDSSSSAETRARMARRDGINKPYGQDGPYLGRTRRSARQVRQCRAG
jgi:hypothetical protein